MADVLKEDDENGNEEGIVIVEDKNELSDKEDDQDYKTDMYCSENNFEFAVKI